MMTTPRPDYPDHTGSPCEGCPDAGQAGRQGGPMSRKIKKPKAGTCKGCKKFQVIYAKDMCSKCYGKDIYHKKRAAALAQQPLKTHMTRTEYGVAGVRVDAFGTSPDPSGQLVTELLTLEKVAEIMGKAGVVHAPPVNPYPNAILQKSFDPSNGDIIQTLTVRTPGGGR